MVLGDPKAIKNLENATNKKEQDGVTEADNGDIDANFDKDDINVPSGLPWNFSMQRIPPKFAEALKTQSDVISQCIDLLKWNPFSNLSVLEFRL